MTSPHAAAIQAATVLNPVPLVPEIQLYQANASTIQGWADCTLDHMPYWAFAWPGGQALARYLLDNPQHVRGKRVLDFACGSGLIGIAAAKAGASSVLAYDTDLIAVEATQINALVNGIAIKRVPELAMDNPFRGADLIVTGDVCYSQAMATTILRWLYYCIDAGTPVLLGDPRRAYAPKTGLRELAVYDVPVLREIEDAATRKAWVWSLTLPDSE
jgi:predicted nicotinamide N-methyase